MQTSVPVKDKEQKVSKVKAHIKRFRDALGGMAFGPVINQQINIQNVNVSVFTQEEQKGHAELEEARVLLI